MPTVSGSRVLPADVTKVGIFGAGTMGPGLAQVFASAGFEVGLWSRTSATLERAMSVIAANLATFAERELIPRESAPQILARITPTRVVEEAAESADLIVETIIENSEAKKTLFEQLDAICTEGAVFTSDTSYLDIFQIMPERRLPRTVIAHWFAPPHIIPLVEVIKGEQTRDETVELIVELVKQVGHVPIVMEKFVPGFCINRLLRGIGREVFYLLDNGYITPEQLDVAVKASIVPRAMVVGFVQRYDFTGLDLAYNNLQNKAFVDAPVDDHPSGLVERVERGDLGAKTGKGFFDYDERPLEQVLQERDAAMLDVFSEIRDLIDKRI